MKYSFRPSGICAQGIEFELEDGMVKAVAFYGGCDGNHKGIVNLVEGMKAEDVIEKLEGVRCGMRKTSCPDQLAQGIKAALQQSK